MKATVIDSYAPAEMNQGSVSPTELYLQTSRPGQNGGVLIPAPTGAEWSWLHSVQEADRRKDEFLAMLGHELRNPLAPISNAVQILRFKGRADPELEELTDVIDRQVQQLTRLVDDLFDVARISQGKLNLQMESLDLRTVVIQAVEVSQPRIDARRHALRVSLPEQAIEVEGDLSRLVQVVVNLLNNSARYSAEGGRIDLEVEAHGGQAILRVRDTGIGIEAAMLPTIFELFTQARGSHGPAGEGLGIGLALVRNTIEMHGGWVHAASAGIGHGSEFVVRLPLERKMPALAQVPPERPWGAVDATSRRILLIDDNRDLADSLAMLLRFAGHEVRIAYDGQTGLALAGVQPPEVVICDITMPAMSGLEVARHLREDLGLHDVPLVAMSGFGQEKDRHLSQEAGFDAHLVKPVQLNNLKAILASADFRRPKSSALYKTATSVP